MDISNTIKSIRESKSIRQIDVAKALDLDPSYYARLEKRGDKMTIEQLKRIAAVLEVSIVEILKGEIQEGWPENQQDLVKRIQELESLNRKNDLIEEMRKDTLHQVLHFHIFRFCHLHKINIDIWEKKITAKQLNELIKDFEIQAWPRVLCDMGLIDPDFDFPELLTSHLKSFNKSQDSNKREAFYKEWRNFHL